MYTHDTVLRVRYAETDQMGYAYYGNYAGYYEVGRVEMLRSLGFSYKKFEENGIMMPVLELNSKYIKPAKYDDEITVRTILKSMPGVKVRFDYELYNAAGELINTGNATLVSINMENNRPCRPPALFMEAIRAHFA